MSHTDSLYKKSNFKRIGEFNSVSPETFKAFLTFDKLALADGKLTAKFKEIIAIAVAHTTGCPFCIEDHVKRAKKYGVTKEEMAESIMVATALKAASAMDNGVNALNSYDGIEDDELYRASYINRLSEFTELGDTFKAFGYFDQQALEDGILSIKEKELLAVAVAHTTGSPYSIDIHSKAAKKAGATKEELAESIMVATALKAGSALAHGVNALVAFDE